MKRNLTMFPTAALMSAAVLLGGPALSQPTQGPKADPAAGLTARELGEMTPDEAVRVGAGRTHIELQRLIANGRYNEALQRCLAFHNQFKSAGLIRLLPSWVELGRRYPKAKAALVEIRDRDARECSEGRGYYALFEEVSAINGALHQEDKTYELFIALRDKDPGVAQQCYALAEGLLMAKGEYQWCYDHMGEPQDRFDSFHKDVVRELTRVDLIVQHTQPSKPINTNTNLSALVEESRRRTTELLQARGSTNVPVSQSERWAMVKKRAEDKFVGQTRQLTEILVATGHQAEAENICAQAVTILDDARLKSAVTDAMNHIRK
jgi:hypothetical protein